MIQNQSACRSTKRKPTKWPRPLEYDDSKQNAVMTIPEWGYDNMETGVILGTILKAIKNRMSLLYLLTGLWRNAVI